MTAFLFFPAKSLVSTAGTKIILPELAFIMVDIEHFFDAGIFSVNGKDNFPQKLMSMICCQKFKISLVE